MTDLSSETVDAVLEQAAQWHARMDCGTGDQVEFEAWRNADPRHAAAFARLFGTAQQVHVLKPLLKRSVVSGMGGRKGLLSRRNLFSGAIAASAVLAIGGSAYLISGGGRVSAMTPVGGQALRVLPDGGTLHINTDSKVQWRFSGHRRDVWLQKGEIALTVQADPRPLYLHGGGQIAEASGGIFNARIRNGALDLLVLEGGATLIGEKAIGAKGDLVSVPKGHAVLADGAHTRLRGMTPDDIQFVSAWQKGEVFFNGETLSAAVEEYNRYLPYKIAIGDPSLQGVRLGGRFNSRDPELFLSSLHASFAISATRTSDGSVVLTR